MWCAAGWPRPLVREEPMLLQGIALKKYFPAATGLLPAQTRGWLKAVCGVNVQVDKAETLGIVGESGSGRTTLAKLFLLLERPTAGCPLFGGNESDACDAV